MPELAERVEIQRVELFRSEHAGVAQRLRFVAEIEFGLRARDGDVLQERVMRDANFRGAQARRAISGGDGRERGSGETKQRSRFGIGFVGDAFAQGGDGCFGGRLRGGEMGINPVESRS